MKKAGEERLTKEKACTTLWRTSKGKLFISTFLAWLERITYRAR